MRRKALKMTHCNLCPLCQLTPTGKRLHQLFIHGVDAEAQLHYHERQAELRRAGKKAP